jgi:hypothetical protein
VIGINFYLRTTDSGHQYRQNPKERDCQGGFCSGVCGCHCVFLLSSAHDVFCAYLKTSGVCSYYGKRPVRETFIPVLAKKIGNIYVDLVQLESREIEQDQMVPHRIRGM